MLQSLRARRWSRHVLVAFVACLFANVVAGLVSPTSVQQVCSASRATKLVVVTDDGSQSVADLSGERHCPLCASAAGLPPDDAALRLPQAGGIAHFSVGSPAARIAALTGGPLPPRGPPSLA